MKRKEGRPPRRSEVRNRTAKTSRLRMAEKKQEANAVKNDPELRRQAAIFDG